MDPQSEHPLQRIEVDRPGLFHLSEHRHENLIKIDDFLYEIVAIPSPTVLEVKPIDAMLDVSTDGDDA